MKVLRVLTGLHAGAQVHLDPGMYRIGTDDDADIQLTDWCGADVLLAVESNGAVSSQRLDPDIVDDAHTKASAHLPDLQHGGDHELVAPLHIYDESVNVSGAPSSPLDPGRVWLVDFVPMQFGETVLCIGGVDVTWPSDLALLSTLLTSPTQAQGDSSNAKHSIARLIRRRYTGIVAACAAICAGVIGIGFALKTNVSRAALTPPDVLLEQRINRSLGDAHLDELHAVHDGNDGSARAVVTGMVRSTSEDYVARQVFERMRPGVIVRRYRVADEIARGIRDSIDVDGVQVSYKGRGVFVVSGAVTDRRRVENALTRVQSDFNKSVTKIEVALTDADLPAPPPSLGTFTALLSFGDVQYAETPDGVKHIYAAAEAISNDVPASATDPASNAASALQGAPAARAAIGGPVPLPMDNHLAATPAH